jgi:hypothetical protein
MAASDLATFGGRTFTFAAELAKPCHIPDHAPTSRRSMQIEPLSPQMLRLCPHSRNIGDDD